MGQLLDAGNLKAAGASAFLNPSQEKKPHDQRTECVMVEFRYWWNMFF